MKSVKWHIVVRRIVTALSHKRLQSFVARPPANHNPTFHTDHSTTMQQLRPACPNRPPVSFARRAPLVPRPLHADPLDASLVSATPLAQYPGYSLTSLTTSFARQRDDLNFSVVDSGFVVDLGAYSAPNPPRSPFPPRSFRAWTHHSP